ELRSAETKTRRSAPDRGGPSRFLWISQVAACDGSRVDGRLRTSIWISRFSAPLGALRLHPHGVPHRLGNALARLPELLPRVAGQAVEALDDRGGGELVRADLGRQLVPRERDGGGGVGAGADGERRDRRGAAAVAQVVEEDLPLALGQRAHGDVLGGRLPGH